MRSVTLGWVGELMADGRSLTAQPPALFPEGPLKAGPSGPANDRLNALLARPEGRAYKSVLGGGAES